LCFSELGAALEEHFSGLAAKCSDYFLAREWAITSHRRSYSSQGADIFYALDASTVSVSE
jgi:hypothetical protein